MVAFRLFVLESCKNMVTAVGVLEWIQETQIYTQASKQVSLERVAQPLRSIASSVDEAINKDVAKKLISDINASPTVQTVRGRGNALCAFVRSSALVIATVAEQSIKTLNNFQVSYPILKDNVFFAQMFSLICLLLNFVISNIHCRFPQATAAATEAPAAPAPLLAATGAKQRPNKKLREH
jgi:hypothetical protein